MGLHEAVAVRAGRVVLPADVVLPAGASSVVVLASDRGAGRHRSATLDVAAVVEARGHGVVLVDLLTAAEDERDAPSRDVALLTERLLAVCDRLETDERTRGRPLGLFAVGAAAAAALRVSARRRGRVGAVVCFDGRPDLAGEDLLEVDAPTLLVIGGGDPQTTARHRDALHLLSVPHALEILPSTAPEPARPAAPAAEHLGELAAEWFSAYLPRRPPPRRPGHPRPSRR